MRELVLSFGEATKTAEVTSLSSIYWGTTTGGNSYGTASESAEWAVENAAVSAGVVNTGHYVDVTAPGTRNFYLSNKPFTVGASISISADNSEDVVVGRLYGCSTATPSVTVNHIFARMGVLTMNAPDGYTIDGINWTIRGKSGVYGTSGTYDCRQQSWSSGSGLAGTTFISSGSDLYVIPGAYEISCSYTLHKLGMSQNVTATADIAIQRGKVNNVTATAIGGTVITTSFALTVGDWGTNHNVTEES